MITLEKISRSCGPCLETVRCAQPIPAQQTEIRSSPSAVAAVDRRLDLLCLEHVRLDEADAVAELARQRRALVGVEVGDHDGGAVGVQAARGRLAEARGPADDECVDGLRLHRTRTISARPRSPTRHLGSLVSIAPTTEANLSQRIADRLTEARERTLLLIEPLADEQLNTVYSPILSPLAWDLGHIANFEELWLVQRVGGREPMRGELGSFYDAIENPRKIRNELPILRGEELRTYMDEVRARTLDVLDSVELAGTGDPLIDDGFIYEMLLAHEHQHNETMLQLLQMVDGYEPARIDGTVAGEPVADGPEMVRVEAGHLRDRRRGRGLCLRQRAPPPRGRAGRRSRSTARRSPTPPSPSSSPIPAASRRCTGSATATAG